MARTALLILLILAVHLIGLGTYPRITADEGGWPLSVRNWVETGTRSSDYYMAPGYHWLLAIPFRFFGALHSVGRPVSVAVSLLALFLFHRLTRKLAGDEMAFWATLLLGTSYPAVLIGRRALMEPFQIAIMTGLCLAVASVRWLPMAALTAALLLTKASGIFLVPALAISKRRMPVMAALAGGIALAAAVFYWLYTQDPATFLQGWITDMKHGNVPGSKDAAGRFRVNPLSIELTVRWLSEHEPVLFGISAMGLLKALWDRKHPLMAAWYLCGAAFLFIQVYVQENHRAVLLPPLCFFGAYLLTELRFPWTRPALGLLAAYSVARIAGGIALAHNPHAATLSWMKSHTAPSARVMAAPYLLMNLPARPASFWTLPPPYVPTPEALRCRHVDWVIVDTEEWTPEVRDEKKLEAALVECCELKHAAPNARIYRVKPSAPTHP
jgi:4-amino-4-deoxy-L-arabinose transferase-like glycosyltransferase